MVVSLFLMLRTLLLTGHGIGSFQPSTVPDARCREDLLLTNNISLLHILSANGSLSASRSIPLHWNAV